MTIKNVIFDFGGVLIDWDPRNLYRGMFKDDQEMEYFIENVCNHEWNLSLDKGLPFKEATDMLIEKFPQYAIQIKAYDTRWIEMVKGDIAENVKLLPELKSRYKMFGLTNWSTDKFAIAYQKYEFFKIFEGIVVSGHEKMIKPDKEIYQLILKRYNLDPSESIFIDDNKKNIETANQLGFNTIHYTKDKVLRDEMRAIELL